MLHSIDKAQIGVLRSLSATENARLVRPSRGDGRGRIVSDIRKESSKSVPVSPQLVRWLSKNKMVEPRRRESNLDPGQSVFRVTLKGANYARRDQKRRHGPVRKDRTTEGPAVKDLILKAIQKAGSKGSTALAIKTWLADRHQIDTHYKTVGMTLYRFSTEGLVKREGWVWTVTARGARVGKRRTAKPHAVLAPPVQEVANDSVAA